MHIKISILVFISTSGTKAGIFYLLALVAKKSQSQYLQTKGFFIRDWKIEEGIKELIFLKNFSKNFTSAFNLIIGAFFIYLAQEANKKGEVVKWHFLTFMHYPNMSFVSKLWILDFTYVTFFYVWELSFLN